MTYAPYMVVIFGVKAALIQGLSIIGATPSLVVIVNLDGEDEIMEAKSCFKVEAKEEATEEPKGFLRTCENPLGCPKGSSKILWNALGKYLASSLAVLGAS